MARVEFTQTEFLELRLKTEESYKKIGDIYCPFLTEKVSFNVKGLDHLKFKKWNHARDRKDQFVRLKLIHLAPEVIKNSRTLQGITEGNRFERIKVNNRWEEKMVYVKYYEFISVIDNCRLRIVTKRVGDSPIYFWSIIPYWKQGIHGKKMFEGNPESD